MLSLLLLAVISFAACYLLTPLVRNLFSALGVVDVPDTTRKLHKRPVPRVGGIAIIGAYVLAFLALAALPYGGGVHESLSSVWMLGPAIAIVFFTGLIDDIISLRPWQKLVGHLAASIWVWAAGVRVMGFSQFSIEGWWTLPLTVLWLVFCTNSFNLIDGVDGLAAGAGFVAASTMLVAAIVQDNLALALATAPLAGCLLAFLRYNLSPASIFLGDCGSLTIGFMLGCFGVIWSQKSATVLGMTAPLMALSLPLLDTLLAIVRRVIRLRPIFGADRAHIHHRLLDEGLTPRRVTFVLYGACGIAAIFSLLQSMAYAQFRGLLVVLFCGAAWVAITRLKYMEFAVARRVLFQGIRRTLELELWLATFEQSLNAATTVQECWDEIRNASEQLGFSEVRLFVAGEFYQARFRELEPAKCWAMHIPLADAGYIHVTRDIERGIQPGAAGPLLETARKTLDARFSGTDAPEVLASPQRHRV